MAHGSSASAIAQLLMVGLPLLGLASRRRRWRWRWRRGASNEGRPRSSADSASVTVSTSAALLCARRPWLCCAQASAGATKDNISSRRTSDCEPKRLCDRRAGCARSARARDAALDAAAECTSGANAFCLFCCLPRRELTAPREHASWRRGAVVRWARPPHETPLSLPRCSSRAAQLSSHTRAGQRRCQPAALLTRVPKRAAVQLCSLPHPPPPGARRALHAPQLAMSSAAAAALATGGVALLPLAEARPDNAGALVFPLGLTPAAGAPLSLAAALAWARAHRGDVEAALLAHAGLFLRGFPLADADAFDALMEALGVPPKPYVGGAAVRHVVVGNVFTSNESPPAEVIPFHHGARHFVDATGTAQLLTAPARPQQRWRW